MKVRAREREMEVSNLFHMNEGSGKTSYAQNSLFQVPQGLYEEGGAALNKGNVYISETSPPGVRKAYLQQFQKDFSQFLKLRSHEVAPNGRMVFTYIGQRASENFERDCGYMWLALVRAIKNLISQGLVKEEKLDSFDLPLYTPTMEEVEEEVRREASFTIERFEELSLPIYGKIRGKDMALAIRAVVEPITKHHFGEKLMDKLFEECAQLIETELLNEMTKAKAVQGPITYVLVLKRSM
ncbi:caffeine synthase 1-like [Amborella trichopoda]|uniref:caffeine synthase 1-like n=1 Tax=Amborella trichopoda TaxID=13333 RepID=UPI0009C024F6|nr:caffeine synthase 1-like [Amborella trichopoda]|eukprot:XP_020523241.1 caffeine synthase 1-like [Amborella trichopoda]